MRHVRLANPAPRTQREAYSILMDSHLARYAPNGIRGLADGFSFGGLQDRLPWEYRSLLIESMTDREYRSLLESRSPVGGDRLSANVFKMAGALSRPIIKLHNPGNRRWVSFRHELKDSVRELMTSLDYSAQNIDAEVERVALAARWHNRTLRTGRGDLILSMSFQSGVGRSWNPIERNSIYLLEV